LKEHQYCKAGPNTREILANIDSMGLAIDHATVAETISVENIVEIHRILMASATNQHVAGVIRTEQNWIGGNNHNPCNADFVPPISIVVASSKDSYVLNDLEFGVTPT